MCSQTCHMNLDYVVDKRMLHRMTLCFRTILSFTFHLLLHAYYHFYIVIILIQLYTTLYLHYLERNVYMGNLTIVLTIDLSNKRRKMHYHWNMVYPLSVKSTDNNFQYIPSGVMEKDDALYRIKEHKDRYERNKNNLQILV